MSKHRAPRRLDRRAVTPIAALALSAAALTAVAPMASAQPRTHDRDSDAGAGAGSVNVLDNLTLLPVQACGLQVPVLSGILDGPSGSCTQSDD